ncbi:MAG TPA: DUF4166 domain-containing protein [Aliidongia sp.]|nr:DUF4166 domain-containing protein [Aliidongia sp.]
MVTALGRPLYPRLLGDTFDRLPSVIRAVHEASPLLVVSGTSTVTEGTFWASRALRRLLRLPAPGSGLPLRVVFEARGDGERLSRHYPGATLTTMQKPAGRSGSGLLCEKFGPFSLIIQLEARSHSLSFTLIDVRFMGLSVPRWLMPRLTARESADDGRYHFFVRIDVPGLGRLIQYQGCLDLPEAV